MASLLVRADGRAQTFRAGHVHALRGADGAAADTYQGIEQRASPGPEASRASFFRGMAHARRVRVKGVGEPAALRRQKLAPAESALAVALGVGPAAGAESAPTPDSPLHSHQLWTARFAFGTLAAQSGRHVEAAAQLRAAAAMSETQMPSGGKVAVHVSLAAALDELVAALDATGEALKWLRGVPESAAALHGTALHQRALLLVRLGRLADAEATLRELAAKCSSRRPVALLALSSVCARAGEMDKAVAALQAMEADEEAGGEAAPSQRERSLMLEARARLWLHTVGSEVAATRLRQRYPPPRHGPRLRLAVQDLCASLEERPASAEARAAYGWANWLAGDLEAAQEELGRAASGDGAGPLPSLYRAFIAAASPPHGHAASTTGAAEAATAPFREAAEQLLKQLPARSPPSELLALIGQQPRGWGLVARAVKQGVGEWHDDDGGGGEDPDTLVMLASCVVRLADPGGKKNGRSPAAAKLLAFALELLSPLVETHESAARELACLRLSRAKLLLEADEVVAASEDLTAAIASLAAHTDQQPSLRSLLASAWCNLGVTAERAVSKRVALEVKAEACFGRAIALAPHHTHARANLGAVLVGAGRHQEALDELNAAIGGVGVARGTPRARWRQLSPNRAAGAEVLAGGSGPDAEAGELDAAALERLASVARVNRAVALAALGDFNEARRLLSAPSLAHHPVAELNAARLEVQAGDYHAAREMLRESSASGLEAQASGRGADPWAHQAPALAVLCSDWCECLDAAVVDFEKVGQLIDSPPAAEDGPRSDRACTPLARMEQDLLRWAAAAQASDLVDGCTRETPEGTEARVGGDAGAAGAALKGVAHREGLVLTTGQGARVLAELEAYLSLLRAGPKPGADAALTKQQARVAIAIERWSWEWGTEA